MDIMGVDAKWWAAGGGILLIGVWYWRRMSANEAPAAPEDVAIGEDAAVASGDVQGTTPSLYGYYNPSTGQFIGASGTTQVITTNAQWAQQVLTSMTVSFIDTYDPATMALAIANYLAGRALTDTEFNIAETAIQLYGRPPTAVPEPHKANPTGGQTQTPSPVTTAPKLASAGLGVGWVLLAWNPVANAKQYEVQLRPWGSGGGFQHAATLGSPGYRAPIINRKSGYYWRVAGVDATGKPGPWSNVVSTKPQT